MKKSTLTIIIVILSTIVSMVGTNVILKNEYQKIDLSDSFKNYISVNEGNYSVLHISGSNGYPIDFKGSQSQDIKVLRARQNHYSSHVKGDTLFIKFSGANISRQQALSTQTPAGIIVENNELSDIIVDGNYYRIKGLHSQNLKLTLVSNSLVSMKNSEIDTLHIIAKDESHFELNEQIVADSLSIVMSEMSVGYLEEVNFTSISHNVQDSTTIILSKSAFNKIAGL